MQAAGAPGRQDSRRGDVSGPGSQPGGGGAQVSSSLLVHFVTNLIHSKFITFHEFKPILRLNVIVPRSSLAIVNLTALDQDDDNFDALAGYQVK